jgi:hypothetical protein
VEVQMKSALSWKLVPLAAIAALGFLALVPGGIRNPQAALAANDCTLTKHQLRINIIDNDTGDNITSPGASVLISPDPVDGVGTKTYVDNGTNDDASTTTGLIQESTACQTTDADYDITLDPDTVNCDVVDGDTTAHIASANVTVELHVENCVINNITVSKTATGGTGDESFSFTISGPGNDCDDSFDIGTGDSQSYACSIDGPYIITEASLTGWSLTDISCDSVGGLDSSNIVTDVANRKVTITISDETEGADCTFTNTKGGGSASTITASAGPNSVSCGGSSFISLVVKDANGQNVADGTNVNVATNLGTVNPTTATTSAGGALILYTAPSNAGGTATITATAGSATGSATVAVNCAQATPTPAPAPTVKPGSITAPNTGDAGLADSHDASWSGLVGAALIVGLVGAGLAIMRVRA